MYIFATYYPRFFDQRYSLTAVNPKILVCAKLRKIASQRQPNRILYTPFYCVSEAISHIVNESSD